MTDDLGYIEEMMARLYDIYASYSNDSADKLQDFFRNCWKKTVAQGERPVEQPAVPVPILDAWTRVKKAGINPNKTAADRVVSAAELARRKQASALFFQVSRSVLQNMYNFLKDSGLNLAISDSDGILLDVFGDDGSVESSRVGGWTPGADWSERSMGNNAIGTAIYMRMPLTVSGYEHYCRCSHHWAAASSPIFSETGDLLGVIALCGPYRTIHAHTLGMIIAIAQMIQFQIQIHQQRRRFERERQALIDAVPDGLVGISASGVIRYYNRKLRELLGLSGDEALGKDILVLLPRMQTACAGISGHTALRALSGKESALAQQGNAPYICTPHPLVQGEQEENGTILVVRKNPAMAEQSARQPVRQRPPSGAPNGAMWTFDAMVGRNEKFLTLKRDAAVAARTDSNIFLLGESGTGKDVLAQAIHNESPRRNGPFVSINCAALPKELIVSELFGYAEGTFTGAKRGGKKGKFEAANGGTIFLDEIGDMPLEQQAVLLRVLEDSSFSPLGSSQRIPLNVRIIAATNKNVYQAVEEGRFRSDLFYRLHVFMFCTVPLRERRDDLELLADSFLRKMAGKTGRGHYTPLSRTLLDALSKQDFPGNIREFQNCLERAYMLAAPPEYAITPNLLLPGQPVPEPAAEKPPERADMHEQLQSYQAALLLERLKENGNNVAKTCTQLGISRTTFYRKLRESNLKIPR